MGSLKRVTRRNFLKSGGTLSAVSLVRLGAPALMSLGAAAHAALETGAELSVLRGPEAADLAAIAARIIPTTDTPGAREAGVIYFFDRAFADAMAADLPAVRLGLAEFNTLLRDAGHEGRFADLDADAQDKFLRARERSTFFELARTMTIFGFFAMSSYGGNRDGVGWELLGFKGHQGAWSYPFGYYDAEYAKETADGE